MVVNPFTHVIKEYCGENSRILKNLIESYVGNNDLNFAELMGKIKNAYVDEYDKLQEAIKSNITQSQVNKIGTLEDVQKYTKIHDKEQSNYTPPEIDFDNAESGFDKCMGKICFCCNIL